MAGEQTVTYVNATVTTDANCKTPVCVPFWEVPLLAQAHGSALVSVGEPEKVKRAEKPVAEHEYGRLSAKYGAEMVEKVFGVMVQGGMAKAMATAPATLIKSAGIGATDAPMDSGSSAGGDA